jgi:hypothetical protein
MKLKWIEFENLDTGLKIEKINFNDDVTLMVGLSGVGKTQILKAISYSLKLAVNKNARLRPYHVSTCIEIDGTDYEWEYSIKSRNVDSILGEEESYYFHNESLKRRGEVLFNRCENDIKVSGYDKIPTPKKDESLLIQYAENDEFMKLISEIRKFYPIDMEVKVRSGVGKNKFDEWRKKLEEYFENFEQPDLEAFSHLSVVMKVYVAKNYYKDVYNKIIEIVKEIFAEIDDIDVVEDVSTGMYLIAIKVYGKVLTQPDISNGMLKAIYYIVELMTMPQGALILIDEFENGLGVNCIDSLSEILLNERTDLQFIITSHHPKIVNGISIDKWKIIERTISSISNINSDAYGIGNSQHEAYFNLVNRWEYEGKI